MKLLRAMLAAQVRFLLSDALIAEYRDVLKRPRIAARHGMTDAHVDALIDRLVVNGTWITPTTTAIEGPDSGDAHLWHLLRCYPDAVLVTGDIALIEHAPLGCRVITLRAWLDQHESGL